MKTHHGQKIFLNISFPLQLDLRNISLCAVRVKEASMGIHIHVELTGVNILMCFLPCFLYMT